MSVRGRLLVLVVAFVIFATLLAGYHRVHVVDHARETTKERMGFQADLAAQEIDDVIDETLASTASLAANPALAAIRERVEGCTLAASAASPFPDRHIDIVAADGTILCSSSDAMATHAGADWLQSVGDEVTASGPQVDPTTGRSSLLVAAAIPGGGSVVTFLAIDSLPAELSTRFGGPLRATFTIDESEDGGGSGISGRTSLRTLPLTVAASVHRSVATHEIDDLNRRELVFLVAGMLGLGIGTWIVHRGLARPIRRLDAWVRGTMSGSPADEPPMRGPAEVASLARAFQAMTERADAQLNARANAESDARAAAERNRLLFESNPHPMWVHDRATLAVLDVNAAMVATFGWSRAELLGMTVGDLLTSDSAAELALHLESDATLERVGPYCLTGASALEVDCEISSEILSFGGSSLRLVIAEDVTSQQRSERLLRRAERMDSLGHLAGGMAHDFNNVLAVMMSYSEFVEEEIVRAASDDPERWNPVVHDVQAITDGGRRAAGLTRQLLAFARGDAATIGSLDVSVVVADLKDMLIRTLGERVRLVVSGDDDVPSVRANRTELEQVIVNLSVNARDAMPDGGTLSIETSTVEVDEHNANARPDLRPGPYVRLRVSDTGVGMDPATLDHAFDPFFTTKGRGSGTGLGLATVYGIVTRARGAIQVYSEPGHGTTVSVMLPADDREASVAGRVPVSADHGRGETVLIVEDDEDIRAVAERILVRAGFVVLTADDGPAALDLVASHVGRIDLVLSDVVMPAMLGTELAARLADVAPGLPVLLMSGYAPPVLQGISTVEVTAPILDKPFSAASLIREVLAALAGRT